MYHNNIPIYISIDWISIDTSDNLLLNYNKLIFGGTKYNILETNNTSCLTGPIIQKTEDKYVFEVFKIVSKHEIYHICNINCKINQFIMEHDNDNILCIIDNKHNFL